MRTFIAAEVSDEFAWACEELARALSAQVDGRFVAPEDYHLTLAFLGEIGEAEAAAAVSAIDAALAEAALVPLVPESLDAFGRSRRKALVLKLRKVSELMGLAERVRAELDARGIDYDRSLSFMPHLTLARGALVSEGAFGNLPFPENGQATAVALFKSTLTPDGSIYKELYTRDLPL